MRAKITIDKLIDLINKGTKIYKINELNETIQIIEGIIINKNEPNVLISNYKISFTSQLKAFVESNTFKDAMFRPVKRGVLLIDIVDYSKGNSLYFASILTVFNTVLHHIILKLKTINKLVEQIIPSGDGCYLVFNKNINNSFFKIVLIILNEMSNLQDEILEKHLKIRNSNNKLHLRISCTLNETDFFYDISGNRNCYGTALNEAARILQLAQNEISLKYPHDNSIDSVFFDKTVIEQANSLINSLNKNSSHNVSIKDLGYISDKHSIKRHIWWIKDLPVNSSIDLYIE